MLTNAANLLSQTSDHAVNLNPNLGPDLTSLHAWLSKIENSECKKVLTTVQTKHGCKKTTQIESAVTTRWNSRRSETVCASINQFDIDIAIQCGVCWKSGQALH